MENERNRDLPVDLFQQVQPQLRLEALRINTMRRSDRDRQRIDPGPFRENPRVVRIGEGNMIRASFRFGIGRTDRP